MIRSVYFKSCFLALLFIPVGLNAQTVSAREWYGSAQSMGMGDAVQMSQFLFKAGGHQKQADKVLGVKRAQAGYYLPFSKKSLAITRLMFDLESPLADFQLNLARSGTEVLNESLVSLACARSFTEAFSGGIRLGMYRLAGSPLNTGSALLTECFADYLINTQWRLSVYMFNPIAAKVSDIPLIQSYHLACFYHPGADLDFVLEIEKPQRQELLAHLGMEAGIWKFLQLRLGLNYPLMQPSLGLGCTWKKFGLDAACRLHKKLPASYALTLHYTP